MDPSKVPVVDQLVRPHLDQDVHGLTSSSRLNSTTLSYTPSYVKSSEEVNHQAKEVKQLDDKEEEARVVPGGARSLFQSDSVLYTDNNKKLDHNDNSIKPDHGNVQISPQINTGFDSSLVQDRKSYNDQVLKNIQKIRDNINKVLSMNKKKRKVEIQDDSSDEFPIREPGKTWTIKLAKSYWQQVPVTQYNSGGKSSYIQKNKQRINFNPDAVHSRINFNPGVTSMPLASTSRQDPYKDQAKSRSTVDLYRD